jgi:NAD(P)-dependent dehydrogenase (short-subunit alcohol dehydrogenase family)
MTSDGLEGRRLEGKITAVTGATSGSGRAIATRFAAEGASVVMLARGAERLQEMESSIGEGVLGIPTDIGDPDSVRAAFATIDERFGKLDVLINNAGVYQSRPFDQLSDDDVMTQIRTNLLGPILTARAAIPLLRAAGGGDIVNTSSEVTIELYPMMAMYGTTKAGLEGLGRMLGMEFDSEDIRVTTLVQGVCTGPGGGSTDWDPGLAEPAAIQRMIDEGTLRRTMGRFGGMRPDDVAEAHLFVVTRPRGQKLDVIRVRAY